MWKMDRYSCEKWAIERTFMNSTMTKPASVTQARRLARGQMRKLREEMEDLQDYLDLIDARVRDEGKPNLTLAEVERRLALKKH